jgi:hypothetical protein
VLTLGIFTLGIVFVPLAALCCAVGLLLALAGRSVSGFFVSLVGTFLTVVAFIFSPSLWFLAGGLLIASQNMEGSKPASPNSAIQSPSGVAVTEPSKTDSGVTTQVPPNAKNFFEGIWVKTDDECKDEEGPNSRTIIDLGNTVDRKPAPIFDQYENHCLIDRTTVSGGAVTFSATCFESGDDFEKRENGRKTTIKVSSRPNGSLNINGKNFIKCRAVRAADQSKRP